MSARFSRTIRIVRHLFLVDAFHGTETFLRETLLHALDVSCTGVQHEIILLHEKLLIIEYFRSHLSMGAFRGGGAAGCSIAKGHISTLNRIFL